MADENTTVVLGIPIPSSDPVFLGIVGVHIVLGLVAVIAGAVAMLSNKGRGRHSNFGTIYFWCLSGVFVTMSALSLMRWGENYHLFILGTLSFACAFFGRTAARRHWQGWPRLHLMGMGASYIFTLTAFYVDNGKNLPLWKELPQIAFWLLPGAVGVPLILYALFRHPFVLRLDRSRRDTMHSSNSATTSLRWAFITWQRAPCHRQTASCQLRGFPSTTCNTGSRRCLRGGTAQRPRLSISLLEGLR